MLEMLLLGGALIAIGVNDTPLYGTPRKIHKIFQRAKIGVQKNNKSDSTWLYPSYVRKEIEDGHEVLFYKLPLGMELFTVIKGLGALCDGLGCEIIPKQIEGDKDVDFKLTILCGHLMENIPYTDQLELVNKGNDEVWIPIGISRRGFEQVNINDDENNNVLICGSPGSGKSVLERLIATSLHVNNSPDDIEIWVADFKNGVENDIFGNTEHIKYRCSNPDQAEQFFGSLLQITLDRYEEFKTIGGCVNIKQYNMKSKKKMRKLVCIVDEFGTLEDPMNESYKKARLYAKKVAQISRAAGVSLILSCQKPDLVIDQTFRSYLNCVIGFRTKTAMQSASILSSKDDDRLKHIDPNAKGRCILQTTKEIRCQVPHLTPEQAEKLVRPYQRKPTYQVAK